MHYCDISGLKSHDVLERLLSLALSALTNDICDTLIEVCMFFKETCCKVPWVDDLIDLSPKPQLYYANLK